MITTIQPGGLKGSIQAPASKSSMQRACAAALLRAGETVIHHPGYSNDDKAALRVIQALGAKVGALADGSLLVRSSGMVDGARAGAGKAGAVAGEAAPAEVNCGESGLGLRMFAPIIGLSDQKIRVVGEGSLMKRPMDFFDEIFPQLGIRVVSNGGKLPLEIQGPLQPRDIEIDGSLSSQFLTGVLFAFAAAGAPDVTIRVRDLKSRPYIDLTLQVMREFGWEIGNKNYEAFTFPAERQSDGRPSQRGAGGPTGGQRDYTVEGDWSGGAFLLVAGAIAGPVTVRGLDTSSAQADKAIVRAICDAGAFFEDREEGMVVGPPAGAGAGGSRLGAFRFDATDCPDLFPPLVALAAYCSGTTEILGVSRLAHKESDRGLTLQEEFGKMGVKIELDGDRMLVHGGGNVAGATVHSRHDHRIAMACAVAALKAAGPVTIGEADAINKSYPDFYFHLQQLGSQVNIQA
ncbi:MAG TPA: 3-phosphoshikimate 1-carboxyvinyltransferase [Puia sp.]|nr:3-phosphoshikimate 1-carboxyvinyltransferase [Puia sp.]